MFIDILIVLGIWACWDLGKRIGRGRKRWHDVSRWAEKYKHDVV